jgi:hypothetical protein
MPAATPTSNVENREYLSKSDAKVFKRCETLQSRIVQARLWLSVLAVLSLLDAPAIVIQGDYVEFARFYTLALGLIAVPIIFYINWCKTLQFGFRHRVGVLRLSLKGVSVFWMLRRTIYRNELIVEICMWLVFTPPYIHDIYEWTKLLDLGCFLRMYALLLYYGAQHYSSHVSCQALARLGRRHLNLHFVMASTLYAQPAMFLATVIFVFWVATSLIFARLEGRDILDSFYFVWVSCALVGYGDVYPRTFGGQVVAIFCGSFSWIVLGFAMHPFSNTASGFRPRSNMYLIVIATAVLLQRRESAAVVIAWTFRHAKVRRKDRDPAKGATLAHAIQMQVSASKLHDRCKSFVRTRNAAYDYIQKYDTMMSEVSETKFLDVFSANKDKSAAQVLAYEKKKRQEYLQTLLTESPTSSSAHEDLSGAMIEHEGKFAAIPTGMAVTRATLRILNCRNDEAQPTAQHSVDASGDTLSFDDLMVEAQLSFSEPPLMVDQPFSVDEAAARRVEAKLARLASLLVHITTYDGRRP